MSPLMFENTHHERASPLPPSYRHRRSGICRSLSITYKTRPVSTSSAMQRQACFRPPPAAGSVFLHNVSTCGGSYSSPLSLMSKSSSSSPPIPAEILLLLVPPPLDPLGEFTCRHPPTIKRFRAIGCYFERKLTMRAHLLDDKHRILNIRLLSTPYASDEYRDPPGWETVRGTAPLEPTTCGAPTNSKWYT